MFSRSSLNRSVSSCSAYCMTSAVHVFVSCLTAMVSPLTWVRCHAGCILLPVQEDAVVATSQHALIPCVWHGGGRTASEQHATATKEARDSKVLQQGFVMHRAAICNKQELLQWLIAFSWPMACWLLSTCRLLTWTTARNVLNSSLFPRCSSTPDISHRNKDNTSLRHAGWSCCG